MSLSYIANSFTSLVYGSSVDQDLFNENIRDQSFIKKGDKKNLTKALKYLDAITTKKEKEVIMKHIATDLNKFLTEEGRGFPEHISYLYKYTFVLAKMNIIMTQETYTTYQLLCKSTLFLYSKERNEQFQAIRCIVDETESGLVLLSKHGQFKPEYHPFGLFCTLLYEIVASALNKPNSTEANFIRKLEAWLVGHNSRPIYINESHHTLENIQLLFRVIPSIYPNVFTVDMIGKLFTYCTRSARADTERGFGYLDSNDWKAGKVLDTEIASLVSVMSLEEVRVYLSSNAAVLPEVCRVVSSKVIRLRPPKMLHTSLTKYCEFSGSLRTMGIDASRGIIYSLLYPSRTCSLLFLSLQQNTTPGSQSRY